MCLTTANKPKTKLLWRHRTVWLVKYLPQIARRNAIYSKVLTVAFKRSNRFPFLPGSFHVSREAPDRCRCGAAIRTVAQKSGSGILGSGDFLLLLSHSDPSSSSTSELCWPLCKPSIFGSTLGETSPRLESH